jgi:ubiquitin carboxyl-terminal hydrolase L5
LKPGPILLGETGADWIAVAKPAIEDRMHRYASNEVNFALLNIRDDRKVEIETEMAELQSTLQEMESHNDESMAGTINEMKTQYEVLRHELDDINVERERQKQENIRRRHNYFPFILALLKSCAQKGVLNNLVESAKTRKQQQQQAQALKDAKK